jgi:hypothetical protein
MTEVVIARMVRADAIFDLGLGALLLLSASDRLFRALDLPKGQPSLLDQGAGASLIGFSCLLWVAPRSPELIRHVPAGTAAARLIAIARILLWLAHRGSDQLGRIRGKLTAHTDRGNARRLRRRSDRDTQLDEA